MAFGRARPAAETGAATVARMRRSIDKEGWPPGLTVLTGEDRFHLDRAQRVLLAALVPPADRDYALTVYGDAAVDVSVVVASARSLGMFAPSRVVLVRDPSALGGRPEALEEYAARPPAGSYLIVRAPKLDRRRKLEGALASRGRLVTFDPPADAAAATPLVVALAAEKGVALEREAAEMLALITAGDYYRVDAELDKLRSWRGEDGGRIGVADLREVVAGSAMLTGWELANAVGQADRQAALAAVRQLLDAGEEPLKLLGGLAFRARAMLSAKAAIESGTPPERAIPAARLFGRPFRETLTGLERYRLRDLLAFPAALLEADRALKSSSCPPGPLLERLIETLTAGVAERRRP